MKRPTIRLLIAPVWPIVGAVVQHYSPAWIGDGTWFAVMLIGMGAFMFSFAPWEDM